MEEQAQQATWSFPEGSVGHDESVKGYAVEATDGQVGTVSWASYAPGESYMVVSYRDGHDDASGIVPDGDRMIRTWNLNLFFFYVLSSF